MKDLTGFTHESPYKGNKDEWLTPLSLINSLGIFDLDPCSPIDRPWDTAKKHYNINDDGLMQKWEGRVWLNPPYGPQTGEWLQKLLKHGNGIALIFARTETRAFFNYVWNGSDAALFIKGRVSFYHVDGTSGGPASAPSVLVAYGDNNVESLKEVRHLGKFIDLRMQKND